MNNGCEFKKVKGYLGGLSYFVVENNPDPLVGY